MPIRAAGNIVVTYNAQNITAYLNEAELQATIDELEVSNLASTVMEYTPSIANFQLTMSGDWAVALDGILGPDVVTPVKRTCSIAFGDGTNTVTYTWTTNAFITGYTIGGSATDKIVHSPTLRLSGTPSRVVT